MSSRSHHLQKQTLHQWDFSFFREKQRWIESIISTDVALEAAVWSQWKMAVIIKAPAWMSDNLNFFIFPRVRKGDWLTSNRQSVVIKTVKQQNMHCRNVNLVHQMSDLYQWVCYRGRTTLIEILASKAPCSHHGANEPRWQSWDVRSELWNNW